MISVLSAYHPGFLRMEIMCMNEYFLFVCIFFFMPIIIIEDHYFSLKLLCGWVKLNAKSDLILLWWKMCPIKFSFAASYVLHGRLLPVTLIPAGQGNYLLNQLEISSLLFLELVYFEKNVNVLFLTLLLKQSYLRHITHAQCLLHAISPFYITLHI